MTQEDKYLLLRDLCARLPYGVIFKRNVTNDTWIWRLIGIEDYKRGVILLKPNEDEIIERPFYIEDGVVQPFLRPMSSMTKEEIEEWDNICVMMRNMPIESIPMIMRFVSRRHLDYYNLIPKGLALKAPKGIYDIE